jgi:hypothetical protein
MKDIAPKINGVKSAKTKLGKVHAACVMAVATRCRSLRF